MMNAIAMLSKSMGVILPPGLGISLPILTQVFIAPAVAQELPLLTETAAPLPPVVQRLETVQFNPPPIDPQVVPMPLAVQQDGAQCMTSVQPLLPLQAGGLTHRGFPHLHFVQQETTQTAVEMPERLVLALKAWAADQAQEIVLQPAPVQLPGYLSLMPVGDVPQLEPEQRYDWSLSVPCNGSAESQQLTGWIETVVLPDGLTSLGDATELEQVRFYSQYGLWYDALDVAMELGANQEQIEPLELLLNSSNLSQAN